MNVLSIIKWLGRHDAPKFNWIKKATEPNHFILESINFNTFIRAFAHDKLQWRYIELKLCEYFRVENWNIRLMDAYPEEDCKSFVEYIWKVAMEIAEEIHIV